MKKRLKEWLILIAFYMATFAIFLVTFGGIVAKDFMIYESARTEISSKLDWHEFEKGDLLVFKKSPYPILGAYSTFSGAKLIVQKQPGSALLGNNRKRYDVGWLARLHEPMLVRQDDPRYKQFLKQFEVSDASD